MNVFIVIIVCSCLKYINAFRSQRTGATTDCTDFERAQVFVASCIRGPTTIYCHTIPKPLSLFRTFAVDLTFSGRRTSGNKGCFPPRSNALRVRVCRIRYDDLIPCVKSREKHVGARWVFQRNVRTEFVLGRNVRGWPLVRRERDVRNPSSTRRRRARTKAKFPTSFHDGVYNKPYKFQGKNTRREIKGDAQRSSFYGITDDDLSR